MDFSAVGRIFEVGFVRSNFPVAPHHHRATTFLPLCPLCAHPSELRRTSGVIRDDGMGDERAGSGMVQYTFVRSLRDRLRLIASRTTPLRLYPR